MKTIIIVLGIVSLAAFSVPFYRQSVSAWDGFSRAWAYARSTGDWRVFSGETYLGLAMIALAVLGLLALAVAVVRRARRARRSGFALESHHA